MQTVLTESLVNEAIERSKNFPVQGFVYGQGPVTPKFMLVGEAPGENEALNGIPFSGRAGKELMKFFDFLGVSREEVYITSAFRSRPYKEMEKIDKRTNQPVIKRYNRPPTKRELLAHAPVLDHELKHVKAPIILTVGNVGLKRLIGNQAKVSEMHGQLYEGPVQYLPHTGASAYKWSSDTFRVFPTFHPASIFYKWDLLNLIYEDLASFKKFL